MKLDHDVMNVYLPLKWVGDGRKRGVTINTPSLLRSQEIVRLRFPNGLNRADGGNLGYDFHLGHNPDTRIPIPSDRKGHMRIARSNLSFQTLFHISHSPQDPFAASGTPSSTCSRKDQWPDRSLPA